MSLFEAAAAVAAEANGGKDGEDEASLAEAAAVWERRSSEDALSGGKSSTSPGLRFMGKPAVVGVVFSCSTDEEVQFPAFAQETLGDIVTRIVRRLPRSVIHPYPYPAQLCPPDPQLLLPTLCQSCLLLHTLLSDAALSRAKQKSFQNQCPQNRYPVSYG